MTAPFRILDSHQHFWRLDNPGHAWPDADWPAIHRDFLPVDLREQAAGVDLAGTVLIQSQPDDRDTDWLLDLAFEVPLVRAVVGWAALDARNAPDRIAALATRPKLVGLRPMLQGIADTEWILSSAVEPALDAMVAHGLRFDALVQPRHLPVLHRLATRWPDLPIVIDHGAKPLAAQRVLDPWRDDLTALAALPNIWCKLSGLRTEQLPGQSADALRPYVAHMLSIFDRRIMWGSDWPVVLHMGDHYTDWIDDVLRLAGPIDDTARARLFHDAACDFYGLTGES